MMDTNMNDPWGQHDEEIAPADVEVTAMLRAVGGEVPFGAVDWGAMHRCIVGDATGILQRLQRRPWLTWMAQWSPVAIPCGLVAGAAALLLLSMTPPPQRLSTASPTVPSSTFAAAVTGSASAQTLADGIVGTMEGDTLLSRIIHD